MVMGKLGSNATHHISSPVSKISPFANTPMCRVEVFLLRNRLLENGSRFMMKLLLGPDKCLPPFPAGIALFRRLAFHGISAHLADPELPHFRILSLF